MDKTGEIGAEKRSGTIGEAIRSLRKGLGMRQADLAEKSGMSAAQLCHIEKRKSSPSIRTLGRIAEALGVPLASLTSGRGKPAGAAEPAEPAEPETDPFGEEPLSFQCRTAPPDYVEELVPVGPADLGDLPDAAREQVRARILEYRALEEKTGVPVRPSLPLDYPAETATGDPEALARAVRRAAGVLDAVLFDAIALLESKGLRVVAADLPEETDSFALWDEEARNAWLVVRKASTDERQQFRAACTLADVLRFVAGGASRPVGDAPADRRFARSFAAAFLMPEAPLRELCYRLGLGPRSWTWELLLREKRRYAVSAEAFACRLEALELLAPALRLEFVRRAKAWSEERGGEPEPSRRKALRHSRFSDLKMLAAAGAR